MVNMNSQLGHQSTITQEQSLLILDVKEPSDFLQGTYLKQRNTQQC